MKPRSFVLPLTLGLALVALPAFARPAHGGAHRGEDCAGKHEGRDKKFPITAGEFKDRVEKRAARAREKMEKRLSEKQVPPEKAKEIRQKFDAGLAKVRAEVNKVAADGIVTKDEAKSVRQLVKQMRPKKHPKHQGDPA